MTKKELLAAAAQAEHYPAGYGSEWFSDRNWTSQYMTDQLQEPGWKEKA